MLGARGKYSVACIGSTKTYLMKLPCPATKIVLIIFLKFGQGSFIYEQCHVKTCFLHMQ